MICVNQFYVVQNHLRDGRFNDCRHRLRQLQKVLEFPSSDQRQVCALNVAEKMRSALILRNVAAYNSWPESSSSCRVGFSSYFTGTCSSSVTSSWEMTYRVLSCILRDTQGYGICPFKECERMRPDRQKPRHTEMKKKLLASPPR